MNVPLRKLNLTEAFDSTNNPFSKYSNHKIDSFPRFALF